jgi:HSP20 family protein
VSNLTVWTRRDPFAEFDRTFTTLVGRAFAPASTRRVVRPAGFVPAADLTRDGEDAVLRLELPGVDVENDVTVELDQGVLRVHGEKRNENADDTRGYREVRYGSFTRTFRVPEHVAAEAVSASYDAGVLSVRVAGAYAEPEPTATRIAITGTDSATDTEPDTASDTASETASE